MNFQKPLTNLRRGSIESSGNLWASSLRQHERERVPPYSADEAIEVPTSIGVGWLGALTGLVCEAPSFDWTSAAIFFARRSSSDSFCREIQYQVKRRVGPA